MSKIDFSVSRRSLLAGASAAAALAISSFDRAFGKAPLLNTPAPYFYRFKLGSAEATIGSDGTLPLGDPHTNFTGLSKEEMDRQLNENFLPIDNAVLEQNVLVLNTGDRLVLFDTGMGSLKIFGPTTGKLMSTLKQAGIDPKDVDAVVMSHAHIDHCGGCVADDGSRNFPNAQYYITQADYDFWTDETKVPQAFKVFLDTARKNLTPVRDRIHFIIDSGGKSLCYIGDLAHHPVLLLEKPLTEFMYDTDPKQSAQTRVKMLGMLADKKIPLLAYHFAWPGVGHVAKGGDGFRYFPEPMKMEL